MTFWNRNKRLLKNQMLRDLSGEIQSMLEKADNQLKELEESKSGLSKKVYENRVREIQKQVFINISSQSKRHMLRVEAGLQAAA